MSFPFHNPPTRGSQTNPSYFLLTTTRDKSEARNVVRASHRWLASKAGAAASSSRAPAKGHVRGTCCRCHSRLKIRARFSSLRAVFSSLLSVRSTMRGLKKTRIEEIVYSYLSEIRPQCSSSLVGRPSHGTHPARLVTIRP